MGLKLMAKRLTTVTFVTLLLAFSSSLSAEEKVLSLTDVYQQALARDPTLASAFSANQAAQEIVVQGKALYRPMVNFNASVTATQSDIRYVGGGFNPFGSAVGRSNYEGYSYGVEGRQPIYRKQNLIQIDQSQIQLDQENKRLHLTQQNLIYRVTQAYFDVLIAQDNIALIGAQKNAISSQLAQAKANFEVGSSTITDVNEAKARYDLIIAQEIAAINAHQIAQRSLEAITGTALQKLATVRSDIKMSSLDQSMSQWIEVTTQNNLNIQLAQDDLRFSALEVERMNAGHLPVLDAIARYSNDYTNGGVMGIGQELKSAVIGFQLQIPLYQGGAISSQVRQAVLNKQKAQDDIEVAIRKAELETQRAYLNLNSAIAQVRAYEQSLVSSQSQLESTELGYQVGVRTSVDVLNSQQQLYGAKRDLLQARYNYLISIIRLKAASGIVTEMDLSDINQQLIGS